MFSLMQFRRDQRRKKLYRLDVENSDIDNSDIDNSESGQAVDDKLTIYVATKNAGKGIFMLSSYLESIGKHVVKTKVSDTEE